MNESHTVFISSGLGVVTGLFLFIVTYTITISAQATTRKMERIAGVCTEARRLTSVIYFHITGRNSGAIELCKNPELVDTIKRMEWEHKLESEVFSHIGEVQTILVTNGLNYAATLQVALSICFTELSYGQMAIRNHAKIHKLCQEILADKPNPKYKALCEALRPILEESLSELKEHQLFYGTAFTEVSTHLSGHLAGIQKTAIEIIDTKPWSRLASDSEQSIRAATKPGPKQSIEKWIDKIHKKRMDFEKYEQHNIYAHKLSGDR